MTYFELFNIPPTFLPDPSYLRKKFYALSRDFHPDHHGEGNVEGSPDNIELSANLNAAYRTLQNPDLLTAYLLELEGVINEGEKEDASPFFLLEMMELNEELDEKLSRGRKKDVEHVRKRVEKLIDGHQKDMDNLKYGYNPDVKNEPLLNKIKEAHFKRRYLLRLLEKINNFASP
jgi:molecular chaperone HscB